MSIEEKLIEQTGVIGEKIQINDFSRIDADFVGTYIHAGNKISSLVGFSNKCENIINNYNNLNISYYYKENTGPGDSRNFGMNKAKGSYFVILDSDVILPENYCTILIYNLSNNFSECFGGVDDSHSSFNDFQKISNDFQ